MPSADYERLLDKLRALSPNEPVAANFTRPNLIKLLDILALHFSEALATQLFALDDGSTVSEEHPVAAQLSALVSALRDLDLGLTDEVLKPIAHGANATRPWRTRIQDEMLCVALEVVQKSNGKKRRPAAMRLANALKEMGWTRSGQKALTWSQIEGIYKRSIKQ